MSEADYNYDAANVATYSAYDQGLVSFLREHQVAFPDELAVEETLRVLEAAHVQTAQRLTDFYNRVKINCTGVTDSYDFIVRELLEAASASGIAVGVKRSVARWIHRIFLSINISDAKSSTAKQPRRDL